MSSSSSATKQKKPSRGGIIARVKRRTSKKKIELDDTSPLPETAVVEAITEEISFSDPTTMEVGADDHQFIELSAQLQAAQAELEASVNRSKQDEETIANLQRELQNQQDELEQSRSKLTKVEEITQNLDDDSFHQAQEFQLKKEIDDLQKELEKRKNLEQQVSHLKEEIQDLHTRNEELRFQGERTSTRSKMKTLSEEKTSKEEVQRLQKELRLAEKNLMYEVSHVETQLKVSQDANERLQEKVKIIQKRSDDIEQERLDLKIVNSRLTKKLESSGSYNEKKRLQLDQETAELELKNMKRKTARLEKQLTASNQMLNMMNSSGGNEDLESGSSSGFTSPVPRQTLSEARISHLEKELQHLEVLSSKLTKENEALADKASSCEQTSEVFSLRVDQLDHQLKNEKNRAEELETELNRLKKAAVGDSGEDYLANLVQQIENLETTIKEGEMKFHVKEKDLWSTVEAQKKQIQELEMEKLALELEEEEGEEEEEGDGDERSITPKPESHELNSLREEVEKLKSDNQKLKEDLEGTISSLASSSRDSEEEEKLRGEIEQLKNELIKTETGSANMNAELSLCKQEVLSLKDQNEHLKTKSEANEGRLSSLEDDIQALEQENQELQQKLTSSQESSTASADVISSLEKEVESLASQTAQLIADLENAECELDLRAQIIAANEESQKKAQGLEELNQKLKSDLNNAEDEVEKLDAELEEQTQILQKKIKDLKDENTRLSRGSVSDIHIHNNVMYNYVCGGFLLLVLGKLERGMYV